MSKKYRYLGESGIIEGVGFIGRGSILPDGVSSGTLHGLLNYKQAAEVETPALNADEEDSPSRQSRGKKSKPSQED